MQNQDSQNSSAIILAHFKSRTALHGLDIAHKNLSELSENLNGDDPQEAQMLKEAVESSDIISEMRKKLEVSCDKIFKKCREAIQRRLETMDRSGV